MDNLVKENKLVGQYKPFPPEKKNLNPWDYLHEAFKGPIRSSIPDALESAKKSAQEAKLTTQILSGVLSQQLVLHVPDFTPVIEHKIWVQGHG